MITKFSFVVKTPSLKNAATYFETCMDTKKIEAIGDKPVKELLKKIGKF